MASKLRYPAVQNLLVIVPEGIAQSPQLLNYYVGGPTGNSVDVSQSSFPVKKFSFTEHLYWNSGYIFSTLASQLSDKPRDFKLLSNLLNSFSPTMKNFRKSEHRIKQNSAMYTRDRCLQKYYFKILLQKINLKITYYSPF